MKALIIDDVPGIIADTLEQHGAEVETIVMPGVEYLKEHLDGVEVLVMRVIPEIDKELLDAAKDLKLIAVCSVGTAHIDMDYAREKGVAVVNAPGASANAVAELALSKILDLSRKVIAAHHEVAEDRIWEKYHFTGHELKGRSLGLCGYGRIGRRLAEIARVIGMRILAYDPYLTAEQCEQSGAVKLEMDDFLRQADIITIHLPLTPETNNLFSYQEIAKMKDGAIIVNMSRGGVLDETAAAEGLKSGKLGGVGVDVIKAEMADLSGGDTLHSPLFDVGGNYLVSPHIGARTYEAQDAIGVLICEKMTEFFHWQAN
ncbi:NAD(P)-dependent oxidoreductase [Oscillibacter sp. GMB15532]|uniref:NAD(P)-dependent oxidoreductase n=1 Tax=Oscillibacter sp. GMB15532 TaxID=3230022 RepID=UPI0034DFB014